MKIKILYRADYHYASEVGFSPHIFRLFPKPDQSVSSDKISFETNADADVQFRKDIFDNNIAFCFYPKPGLVLEARLEIDLRLNQRNAFHFLVDSSAIDFPFAYRENEARILSPYLQQTDKVELPFWNARRQPTLDTLVELNSAIFKNIRYERREEGPARNPAETLALGSGSCRDYAVLMAGALRTHGIATRLASGYLCEFGQGEKRAEGALHAWVEAYLPGAGWIGMDPTNGIFCDHNHITAATGLSPDDVSPVSGTYFCDHKVSSIMNASLELVNNGE